MRAAGCPAAAAIMTAATMARFYQALLHDPRHVWDADVLRDAKTNVRCTFADPIMNVAANRTLGLVLAGDDGLHQFRYGMFGKENSPGSFGHAGAHCQVAWADPESGISFSFVKNGLQADMIADAVNVMPITDAVSALRCAYLHQAKTIRKVVLVRTPIAEKLDIEFPIFAFSHCRDVIAAVSRAGGFGVLGALAFTPEELEIELNWIDEHVDGKPYGVDIVMPMKYMGKGGGDEADFSNLDAMIPQEHRDFVEQLLDRHHVPPLPEDLDGGVIKAAGSERRRGSAGPGRGRRCNTRA